MKLIQGDVLILSSDVRAERLVVGNQINQIVPEGRYTKGQKISWQLGNFTGAARVLSVDTPEVGRLQGFEFITLEISGAG